MNHETGKGWTNAEEKAFAQIMATGELDRLSAIRLYRRMQGNLAKALRYASESREMKAQRSVCLVQARHAKRLKGQFDRENRPLTRSVARQASNPETAKCQQISA